MFSRINPSLIRNNLYQFKMFMEALRVGGSPWFPHSSIILNLNKVHVHNVGKTSFLLSTVSVVSTFSHWFPPAWPSWLTWPGFWPMSGHPGQVTVWHTRQCSAAWLKENIFPHTSTWSPKTRTGTIHSFCGFDILQYGVSWIWLKGTDALLYEWHFSDIFAWKYDW